MAITFKGSNLYVSQAEPTANGTVSGFSGSKYVDGYMSYGSDKWYPIGYSGRTYVVRLKFNTTVPLTSFSLDISAGGTENTNGTYQHRMVVSTDSSHGTKSASAFAALTPAVNIRFTSGSYTTITLTCTTNIPAGDFYVYLGPNSNNVSANKYSLIYAQPSTTSYNKFSYTGTNATSYTISYAANGGSGSMASQTKYAGYNITVKSNEFSAPAGSSVTRTITLKKNDGTTANAGTKTVTNTTPKVFGNWKATNGTTYNPGDTYSTNAGTTMTAQWVNGTTQNGKTKLGTTSRSNSVSQIVLTAQLNDELSLTYPLTKTVSYTFASWTENQNGTGNSYNATTEYTFTANKTLYAQYSSSTDIPEVSLPSNIVREGYVFKGWSKTPNGTLISGTSYTPSGTETIYAVWEGGDGIQKGMYIYSDTDKQWHRVVNSKVN